MSNTLLAFFAPLAYALGSVSAGRLLARMKGVDVEKQGSGSVGATNITRVLGKKAGALTLLFDCLKAYVPCIITLGFTSSSPVAAFIGLCVLAGHCFGLPPQWKGGKGIASGLGVYLALFPSIAFFGLAAFIAVFYCSRIVSLSSLVATSTLLLLLLFCNPPGATVIAFLAMSAIVAWRHKENIERLTQGKELKFVSSRDRNKKSE